MSEPTNGHFNGFTDEDRLKGNHNRRSQVTEMIELQTVLHRIVTQPTQQLNAKGEILAVPARELASCAAAWVKLEAQRRAALGLPNPAPVKVEPKTRSKSTPVPRVVD